MIKNTQQNLEGILLLSSHQLCMTKLNNKTNLVRNELLTHNYQFAAANEIKFQ